MHAYLVRVDRKRVARTPALGDHRDMTEGIPPDPSAIGFHGLALLRAWPYTTQDDVGRHLSAIRALLDADDESSDLEIMATDEAYAAWAPVYDEQPNALLEAEEVAIRNAIDAVPVGGLAVDAACGTGRVTAILAQRGWKTVGIDPSEAMLAVARAKDLTATFEVGSLDAIPIGDGDADLVTCALALTHVEELAPAISELARIARAGGTVVLSDIHPIAVTLGAQAFFRDREGGRRVTRNHLHPVSEYVRAFVAADLRIVACEEPIFSEASLALISNEDAREALRGGAVGLPFALVWRLEKPA
jgi:ubiquinone/menaquinone biosynthesis C-methylase UbiE